MKTKQPQIGTSDEQKSKLMNEFVV